MLVADAIIDQIGQPGAAQLQQAQQLLSDIPPELLAAAHNPATARAVIYVLVLDSEEQARQQQLVFLEKSADHGIFVEIQKLLPPTENLPADYRLPLIQIAISSMRQLSGPQYQLFKTNLNKLIEMDNKIDLFEWALQKIVFKDLDPLFEKRRPQRIGGKDLVNCKSSVEILLSVLAISDRNSTIDPMLGFERAGQELKNMELTMLDKSAISFEKLNKALDELSRLKPLQKPALLKACVACILADQKIAPIEMELLRAIGATLDCPIPPIAVG